MQMETKKKKREEDGARSRDYERCLVSACIRGRVRDSRDKPGGQGEGKETDTREVKEGTADAAVTATAPGRRSMQGRLASYWNRNFIFEGHFREGISPMIDLCPESRKI